MAAPTHTYCDYATGNDYKGATFVDGAFTVADMTLTKVGAFTASKTNHWLYLDDNGSGEVTPGYYKIASVTSVNAVVLATSPKSGANDPTDVVCTQAAGTTLLPWRSVQGALDLITRDATNGDQVNVKAGTAQVNQAALNLTTYGTPAEGAPLVLRGYTSAANDGGFGEIDCNGATMWASTAYSYMMFADLIVHNFGNNNGIVLNGGFGSIYFERCKIHKGASSPSGKTLITLVNSAMIGCWIYDAGTTSLGVNDTNGRIYDCYFYNCSTGITGGAGTVVDSNIFVDCAAPILFTGDRCTSRRNSIYSSTANTGTGINASNAAGATFAIVMDNIVEGYSGVGGKGAGSTGDVAIVGYNAFYNNATAESWGDILIDLGNDATLSASPFTNAAGGDFSLNTGVVGAIDGAFPGAWYGPASTTDHADIGAVQNGAGAAGGMLQANKRGNKE